MQLTKKNKIIIGVILLVLVVAGGTFALIKSKQKAEPEATTSEKRRITDPVNVIAVAERPYVTIKPIADGKHLSIEIISLNKSATEADYELEYQSGSMLQGAMGLMQLDSLPKAEEIFLGSCSAGGACTYHENITGGNLLLRFAGGEATYAVKTDWRYFDNKEKLDKVASKDAKFQLQADALKDQRYVIVFNSPGLPEGLKKDVIADNYALTSSGSLKIASSLGTLTIRCNEESETATIVGYDGEEWEEFETTVDGKQATAEVKLMELYTVVR